MSRKYLLLGLALIAYAVTLRLLPHPANFAPLTAVAIFSGTMLPRRYSISAVLLAAILSDALIGFYSIGVMLTVWASYAVIVMASNRWLCRRTILRGICVTLASSGFFFITTNLAVWAFGGLYPHTLAGLQRCFVLALPFFRNSLIGDIFYVVTLFGFAEWAKQVGLSLQHTAALRDRLSA